MELLQTSFPDQLSPEGLSPKRKWQLYDDIRQHVILAKDESEELLDLVAPYPDVPKPASRGQVDEI